MDEILDKLRELKQSASELEDENRDLREKLRFKSDEYESRTPFWYHTASPDRPLCAKCFADKIAAPMGEPGSGLQRGLLPMLCLLQHCSGGRAPTPSRYRDGFRDARLNRRGESPRTSSPQSEQHRCSLVGPGKSVEALDPAASEGVRALKQRYCPGSKWKLVLGMLS